MICNMEYYQIMMLLGGFILYMLLNIYPIIVYIIKTIRERDIKEILIMPFVIIMLLIPMIGSIHGLLIVDYIVGFETKKMASNNRIYRNVFTANWIYNRLSSCI